MTLVYARLYGLYSRGLAHKSRPAIRFAKIERETALRGFETASSGGLSPLFDSNPPANCRSKIETRKR